MVNGAFYSTLDKSQLDTKVMEAFARLDSGTFLHCKRVQKLAVLMGRRLGLTARELNQLRLGGLLHDIGKLGVPQKVLNKKGSLSKDEWALIKLHPVCGWEYIKFTELDDAVKGIILRHHIWANGQGGYPSAQQRGMPCHLTQIVTVADVADAMTSVRPYRPALSVEACIQYLEKHAGTKFNREAVRICTEIIAQGLGKFVG